MESIEHYDESRNGPLMITKDGWFFPVYTLTDGISVYGSMRNQERRNSVMEIRTAGRHFLISKKKWYASEFFVTDKFSETELAVISARGWGRQYTMAFNNGTTLHLKHKGIFSGTWFWRGDSCDDLLRIEARNFNTRKPFGVSPGNNLPLSFDELVLTIFAGIQLILIRQRRSAG